jgi:histone H3/H4
VERQPHTPVSGQVLYGISSETEDEDNNVEHSLSKAAFKRIVHEIMKNHQGDHQHLYKIQSQALDILQTQAEAYLSTLFSMCGRLAAHCNRKGIQVKDFQMAHDMYAMVSILPFSFIIFLCKCKMLLEITRKLNRNIRCSFYRIVVNLVEHGQTKIQTAAVITMSLT